MSPRISVLMPVRNGADFVAEAVDSILGQTFRDFELIVIDDGSNDDSMEVLQSRAGDPRLVLRSNGANLGQARTLNAQLDLVSSELVARMDADDLALPHRLERQVAFLDDHPNIGIVGTWIETFGVGIAASTWRLPTLHYEIQSRLLFRSVVAHPTIVARREAIGDLRYREDVAPVEDWDLWQRASFVTTLANLPEVQLRYRVKTEAERGIVGSYLMDPLRLARQRAVVATPLRDLGIDATDDELDLHLRLGDHALQPDLNRLDAGEAWLLRLVAANRDRDRYEIVSFERAVADVWFHAAYSFADRGPSIVRRLLASPLRPLLRRVPPRDWARLFIRVAQRRGLPGWDG